MSQNEPQRQGFRWGRFIEWVTLILLSVLLAMVWYSDGLMAMLGLLLLMLATLTSLVLAIWNLAKADILWTFVGLNEGKAIDKGHNNNFAILLNSIDYHVVNKEIVDGAPRKTFLEKFGIYWMGLPPATVHKISFVHERLRKGIGRKTPPDEWIDRDDEPTESDVFLFIVPHTYRVTEIDFSDQMKGNALFDCRTLMRKPLIGIYTLRSQFIDFTMQYVETAVDNVLRTYPLDEFIKNADRSEDGPVSDAIIKQLNQGGKLLAAAGEEVIGGFISRIDPASLAEDDALESEKTAELQGKATIAKAKADAQADKERARGKNAAFEVALEMIKREFPGVPDIEQLQRATELANTIRLSDPSSPITAIGTGLAVGTKPPKGRRS